MNASSFFIPGIFWNSKLVFLSFMFACLAAGRLVQTDCIQVDATRWLFNVPDGARVNHLAVFMTGVQPFPDGYGATVHASLPNIADPSAPVQWRLLGMLSNEKPSAVFKLRDASATALGMGTISPPAQIGISMEPLASVQAQVTAAKSQPAATSNALTLITSNVTPSLDIVAIGRRLCENLLNHVLSYGTKTIPTPSFGQTPQQYVPMRAIQEWSDTLARKCQMDPSYALTFIRGSTEVPAPMSVSASSDNLSPMPIS